MLFFYFSKMLILLYNSPLNNMGLNYVGSFTCRLFSINILEKFVEVCDNLKTLTNEPYDFLNIFFSYLTLL